MSKSEDLRLIKATIKELKDKHGIHMSVFERHFNLPKRTTARWQTGDFSSTVVAFMRIVSANPFIALMMHQKAIEKEAIEKDESGK